jgi:hypothetical protein
MSGSERSLRGPFAFFTLSKAVGAVLLDTEGERTKAKRYCPLLSTAKKLRRGPTPGGESGVDCPLRTTDSE